jgi:hypothetical protein
VLPEPEATYRADDATALAAIEEWSRVGVSLRLSRVAHVVLKQHCRNVFQTLGHDCELRKFVLTNKFADDKSAGFGGLIRRYTQVGGACAYPGPGRSASWDLSESNPGFSVHDSKMSRTNRSNSRNSCVNVSLVLSLRGFP